MAPEISIRLPSEIITEILYRLPVKSVGRFRCVSKDWLSLLSSPQFIKTHQNTLNQYHLIFVSDRLTFNAPYSISFHHHKEELPTEICLKLPVLGLSFRGSCNGLILLYGFNRNLGHDTLVIVNPTTRETVELPDFPYELEYDDVIRGLGYDSLTDDYKVVTIHILINANLNVPANIHLHVYSLRTNTWTRLSDYPYNYYKWMKLSDACVNGFLHWVAKRGSNIQAIVAFSLADDKFTEVPSPNDLDIISANNCELAVLGGKLGIFMQSRGEVWLMNEYGVKESWTKIIINGLNKIPMLYRPMIFYLSGRILLVGCNKMLVYDIEEGRFCEHINTSCNLKNLIIRGIYVESLVSPRLDRID